MIGRSDEEMWDKYAEAFSFFLCGSGNYSTMM